MRASRSCSLAVVMVAVLAACGGDDDDSRRPYQDDGKLKVMTRNLYLGADLQGVIDVATRTDLTPTEQGQAFIAATTGVWADVRANDFPSRAASLADEIATEEPDLVGLQEATLYRVQNPGDAAVGGTIPATQVAIDFLGLLLAELDARGVRYVVATQIDLFELEAPVSSAGGLQDVRLTDRQVILAREGLPLSSPESGVFAAESLVPLPVPGGTIPVKRGWTKVVARIGGQDVTVFNTHLEAFAALARVAQAAQVAAIINPTQGRVVLVGDLNSLPDTEGHAVVKAIGFGDAWATLGTGAGFTCCFAPDLSEPRTTRDLDERIDYVMWRGGLAPETVRIVGEEDADRTATGLWPSDHAGVVATFGFTTP